MISEKQTHTLILLAVVFIAGIIVGQWMQPPAHYIHISVDEQLNRVLN